MAVMEGALISSSKQSRKRNPSAMPGQLIRIRGADPGHTGDDLLARRCIVTNGNPMPGYRGVEEAEGMDLRQKVQNGRRDSYGGDCSGSGHSLMSLVSFVFVAMILMLPQCSASDPCSERIEVTDEWRNVLVTQGVKTDECDENRFEPDKWYSFSLGGEPASIPTYCIKDNLCGAKIAMRIDLLGQSLPETVGENVTAALCGSYNVLGKYDCCVLRSEVNIARCQDDRLAYNFPSPFDRCPVAVCTLGKDVDIPAGALAKMGEDVSKSDVLATDSTLADVDSTVSEVVTTAGSDLDTTQSLDEMSSTPLSPQPFIQQSTVSDLSTSTSEDDTSVTNLPLEHLSSADSTVTSKTLDADSASQDGNTSRDVTMESTSEAQSAAEAEETTRIISDLYTVTFPTIDTSPISTVTPPLLTRDETDTTEAKIFPDTSQEMTSEIPADTTSSVDLPSTTDMLSSDLPSETDSPSSDLHSTTDIPSEDQSSTTIKLPAEIHSTTRKLSDDTRSTFGESSTEVGTSGIPDVGSDTITNITTISDSSDMTTATSSMEETSVSKTKSKILTTTSPVKTATTITRSSTSSPSLSTVPGDKMKLNQDTDGDYTSYETVRLVFKGNLSSVDPVGKVYELLDQFLKTATNELKSNDGSEWTYEILNVSEAMNFENRKTYIDFRIKHNAYDYRGMSNVFELRNLKNYISENSDMTLLAACRASKNCQHDSFEGAPLASTFEKNAPAFITVIVLCSICLLILVVAVLYVRLTKRGSWKAPPDTETNTVPDKRHYFNENQSPFTDAQIMKDEMVDNGSFNDSAKDGDTNLSGTWVIPLDQDPNSQKTAAAIATEDTKF